MEQWREEALLHDGRTVEVHRKISFELTTIGGGFGWINPLLFFPKLGSPEKYSIEVVNPDTRKWVVWSEDNYVKPIMIDFVDGVPYLAVYGQRVFQNTSLYGCPDIPYVFFKYDTSAAEWVRIPRSAVPKDLSQANLIAEGYIPSITQADRLFSKERVLSNNRDYARRTKPYDMFSITIPSDFEDWTYSRKNRFKNERIKDDCRPPLPRPVDVINPKSPISPSQSVDLDIFDTKNFDPEMVATHSSEGKPSEFSKLIWDSQRVEACKVFLKPADPDNPLLDGWQGFVQDKTGQQIMASTGGTRLCDPDVMWIFNYAAERDRIVIIKVNPSGEVLYRISFKKPVPVSGYYDEAFIAYTTFKAENGFLTFEWYDTRSLGNTRYIKRIIKVKIKEPSTSAPFTVGGEVAEH